MKGIKPAGQRKTAGDVPSVCSFRSLHSGINNPQTQKLIKSLPFQTNGYVFQEFLGSGSYAIVMKVHHIGYNCDFAAKCIPFKNENEIPQEAETIRHLTHPHIIKIYESFEYHNHFVFIMQYCPYNLKSFLSGKHVPMEQIKCYLNDLLDALQYLHSQHIAHRDIKPANILIDINQRVFFADFGLSVVIPDDSSSTDTCGPLLYRSPEMLANKPFDAYKADVWALGVTFYIMVTGNDPWRTYSVEAMKSDISAGNYTIPEDLPQDVVDMIRLILTVDPDQRPYVHEIKRFSFNSAEKFRPKPLSNELKPYSSTLPSFPSAFLIGHSGNGKRKFHTASKHNPGTAPNTFYMET